MSNVNQEKLGAFLGKLVGDLGATMSASLVILGDELGLYRALATAPMTSAELSRRTETTERYVREWLDANAAAGYVEYDPKSERYSLSPEQAATLADEKSPAHFTGAFLLAKSLFHNQERMIDNFKNGKGLPWGEQHECLFKGTERFFRAGYVANLVGSWLPALDGVVPKLLAGGRVADVGCGHGASTILMAQAFPKATIYGFDTHEGSIQIAKKRAEEAGVGDRVRFEVAGAASFPGSAYDLVTVFDAFHDLEDPSACARRARAAVAPDGTFMVVEPNASDKREENHNPVGRVFYSASTCICVAHSLSRQGPALGAQAGEGRLKAIITEAGFGRWRRATETPFNIVLEARP